jgi:hypothetical protein
MLHAWRATATGRTHTATLHSSKNSGRSLVSLTLLVTFFSTLPGRVKTYSFLAACRSWLASWHAVEVNGEVCKIMVTLVGWGQ